MMHSASKLQSQIKKLRQQVESPPVGEQRRTWIREKASEVKVLLKELVHQPQGGKFELLDQLSMVRQKLSEMNKERQRSKGNTKISSISKITKNSSISKSKKSSVSRNQSVNSVNKPKKKKNSIPKQTPKFKNSKVSKKVNDSKTSVRSKGIDRSVGNERSLSRISRSFVSDASSRKPKSKSQSIRKLSKTPSSSKILSKKVSKHSISGRPRMIDNMDMSSSTLFRPSVTKNKKQMRQLLNTSSSVSQRSLSSHAQVKKGDLTIKFNNLLNTEKALQSGAIGHDEEQMLSAKLDNMNKEKWAREYRILYYRNREVRQLLQEYFNANADLVEQADNARSKMLVKMRECKQLKKEREEVNKRTEQLQQQLDKQIRETQLIARKQRKEEDRQSTIKDELDIQKDQYDKILYEVNMLRDLVSQQQLVIEQNDKMNRELQDSITGRDKAIKEMNKGNYQDLYYRTTKDVDVLKDQLEHQRSEILATRVLLEKEQSRTYTLETQLLHLKDQKEQIIEDRELQAGSLKGQTQQAIVKAQMLENQLSQMRFKENTFQDQVSVLKDSLSHLQEECRINSLKLDNREKEIQELRQRETYHKKQLLDYEQYQQHKINIVPTCDEVLQKELQTEKLLHHKCQQERVQLLNESDIYKRQLNDLDTNLRLEQNQTLQLNKQIIDLKHSLEQMKYSFKNKDNVEQMSHNQELIIQSQLQRIGEQDQQLQEQQDRANQLENTNQQQFNSIRELKCEKEELSQSINRLKALNEEKQAELEEIDHMRDNYKAKYLTTKYENRKMSEVIPLYLYQYKKENLMRFNYATEMDKIKQEKESIEKIKQKQDTERHQKTKKLKVISDIQSIIKEHKKHRD